MSDGHVPPVAPQITCESALVTGWIVSIVLFLVLLFFCLGMAIQSKRGMGRMIYKEKQDWEIYACSLIVIANTFKLTFIGMGAMTPRVRKHFYSATFKIKNKENTTCM